MQRAVPDNQKDRIKRRNGHRMRADQYYADQILAPGGSVLPLPNATNLARRDRTCCIRDTKSRWAYAPYKCIPATGKMGDITYTLRQVLPKLSAFSQCQDDHYWTEDMVLDEEDIPNALFSNDDDPGKDFEFTDYGDRIERLRQFGGGI
jgi:hypothetical protein